MARWCLAALVASLAHGASSFDALSDWIGSLSLTIPDTTTHVKLLGNVTLWGDCTKLSLDNLDTVKNGTLLNLTIDGLGLRCYVHTSSRLGEIDIEMEIGGGSSLQFGLDVTPDDLVPPLPVSIKARDCRGNFEFPKPMNFTPKILDYVARPLLEGALSHSWLLCSVLDAAIDLGSGSLLHKANNWFRNQTHQLDPIAHAPEEPEDPDGDLVDIQSNAMMPALKDFLGELMNKNSQQYINTLIPPNLCADSMLPKSLSANVGDQAHINVIVKNFTLSGLDSFSKLALDAPTKHQVKLGIGLETFQLHTTIRLEVTPLQHGVLKGDALAEDFDLSFSLDNLDMDIAAAMIFNASTWSNFAFLELFQATAFGSGVEAAKILQLALAKPEMDFSLKPAGVSKRLEQGLDRTISAFASVVLVDYGPALGALLNHGLGATARDMANTQIEEFLNQPPTWTNAPPVYKSEFLHQFGFLGASAAAAALFGMVLALRMRAKKHGAKKAPSFAGDNDSLEVALGRQQGTEQELEHLPAWESLFTHPRLSYTARFGVPLMILSTALLFISANAGVGVDINVALQANGQNVVNPPPAMEETLMRNVIDMWKGGVYPLSIFIGFFSGVWPYLKLSMMVACWFMPVHKLSVSRRQTMLEFLDAFGKWSLVDTYVLVMFLVAFDVPLSCTGAIPALADICTAAGMDGEFRVYVLPTFGFHYFLIATLMSLSAGLWMSWCHRYAQEIGEYGPAQDYEHDERTGNKRRLSELLLPEGVCKRLMHKCIPAFCVIALILCVGGCFLKTFRFKFLGVMGYVLGDPENVREYSLVSLAFALPPHSINPNTFGIHWIEFFFLVFSGVTVLLFLMTVLVLWILPMTVQQHRKCLVLAQIINSVSGLDVFVVSILASVFQIQPYAQFILREIGLAGVNPLLQQYIPQIPFLANNMDGYNVFDLNSRVMPGFVMLACACVISTVLGLMLLNRCSKALFDSDHSPLSESFARAGSSVVSRGL